MSDFLSKTWEVEYWDKQTMKLDFGPSCWTCAEPKYTDVTKLMLTFGGGMGGGRRTLYITEGRDQLKPDTLVEVTSFPTMEKQTINTKFMVVAEDAVIASVTFKTQHWDIAKTCGFENGNGTIHKEIPKRFKNKIILDKRN